MNYKEHQLTEEVIRCIIQVHQKLGPGFLESSYRRALVIELKKTNLLVKTEKKVAIYYEEEEVGKHRLDILVQGKLIVELKTVDVLGRVHYAQVRSYLKATDLQIALLVNFAGEKADYRRIEKGH